MITTPITNEGGLCCPVRYFQFLPINLGVTIFFLKFLPLSLALLRELFFITWGDAKLFLFLVLQIGENFREPNFSMNCGFRIADIISFGILNLFKIFCTKRL